MQATEPIEQAALTLLCPVSPGRASELDALLGDAHDDACLAFARIPTLHFARVVLLPAAAGGPTMLALESNFDGTLEAHMDDLARELGPALGRALSCCAGFSEEDAVDAGRFRHFIDDHRVPTTTFYVAHGGLSVAQIKNDAGVRRAINGWLEEPAVCALPAERVRAVLCDRLSAQGFVLGGVERGLPVKPWCYAEFVLEVLLRVPYLLALWLLSPVHERADRVREEQDPLPLEWDSGPRIDRIAAQEDQGDQNGLTHLSVIRPGGYRARTLRAALWAVQHFALRVGFEGNLAGLSTIHFARWVVLDDGRLLFFSNYDGSWEAYLGDFIDKVSFWLSVIWTNTRGFPPTRWLLFDGARAEEPFKHWTRTCQLPNQIWYSAYPELSVDEILDNAWIRERCRGTLDEAETRAWLSRL